MGFKSIQSIILLICCVFVCVLCSRIRAIHALMGVSNSAGSFCHNMGEQQPELKIVVQKQMNETSSTP